MSAAYNLFCIKPWLRGIIVTNNAGAKILANDIWEDIQLQVCCSILREVKIIDTELVL